MDAYSNNSIDVTREDILKHTILTIEALDFKTKNSRKSITIRTTSIMN